MINWYRVHRILKELVPSDYQSTLKDTLHYIYVEEQYSLEDITLMTDREILNSTSLSKKMKSLGIEIRRRGGDHNSIYLPLTQQDFIEYSARELADKYGVNISTIYDRKTKLDKEIAKK